MIKFKLNDNYQNFIWPFILFKKLNIFVSINRKVSKKNYALKIQ